MINSAKKNFFEWSNQDWLSNTTIPKGFSRYGTFEILDLENKDKIKDTINKSKNDKIKHLKELIWNPDKRNSYKDYPLSMFIRYIKRQRNKDFTLIFSNFISCGIKTYFYIYVGQDAKDSRMERLHLSASGLTLSTRDYYDKEDENEKIFSTWKNIMKKVCCMPDNMTDKVVQFEKEISKFSLYPHERRDVDARYNCYDDMDKFYKEFNEFDWKQLFINLKIGPPKKIIVDHPEFFHKMGKLIEKTELEVITWWFMWCVYRQWGKYCGDDMEKTMFELFGTALSGVKELRPLEERNISIMTNTVGELIGKDYVELYFPAWKKDKMEHYIKTMISVFSDRVDNLDWMSKKTKEKAKNKLENLGVKIGYPDEWEEYNGIKKINTTMVEQLMEYNSFEYRKNWDKIDKPTDLKEWHMTPQTINAYYNPLLNEIVFPAAILQPPFMITSEDEIKSMGRTLGGIGSVIAHEISHALDDKGSKFDSEGNINDWWTKTDREKFDKLVDKYSNQFEKQMVAGLNVNGKLTAGENIADLGGITIAYYSLLELLDNEDIDQFKKQDALKEFFMSWGNIWKYKSTEEDMKRRILTDPHSPNHLRVNMPLKNFKPFLDMFGVKEGDEMWEDDKVVIW